MTERTDATACRSCTRCSSQCGKTVMWTIGLPLLAAIACGLWGCGGEEPANLNATTTGVTVTITAPKGSGDGAKPVGSAPTTQAMLDSWDGTKARFDFQGVTSASTQPYSLTFAGTIAPGGYTPQWELDGPAGTLTNANTLTPGHNRPADPGEGFVRLKATKGDPPVWVGDYDRRKVIIYRDHLDRDYANFGVGISCGDRNTTPAPHAWSFSRFGVPITMDYGWNCHGTTWHLYDGSGDGSSGSIPTWTMIAEEVLPLTEAKLANIHAACARGNVVAYYTNTGALAHSQTVLSGTTTYGANNVPVGTAHGGVPVEDEAWRWAESEAGRWADNVHARYQPVTVKVFQRP